MGWGEAYVPPIVGETVAAGLEEMLRRAGDEYGPLGVAMAAAQLSDPDVVVRSLVRGGFAHGWSARRVRWYRRRRLVMAAHR
jgi:hypothetical protein